MKKYIIKILASILIIVFTIFLFVKILNLLSPYYGNNDNISNIIEKELDRRDSIYKVETDSLMYMIDTNAIGKQKNLLKIKQLKNSISSMQIKYNNLNNKFKKQNNEILNNSDSINWNKLNKLFPGK